MGRSRTTCSVAHGTATKARRAISATIDVRVPARDLAQVTEHSRADLAWVGHTGSSVDMGVLQWRFGDWGEWRYRMGFPLEVVRASDLVPGVDRPGDLVGGPCGFQRGEDVGDLVG